MDKKTATRVIIGILALVALIFVAFYYFVIQKGQTETGGLTMTTPDSDNPIYPGTGLGTQNGTESTPDPLGTRGNRIDTENDDGGEGTTGGGTVSAGGVVNSVPIKSLGSVFRISDKPVSGATSFLSKNTIPTVRYIERELGKIFDYEIGETKAKRISIETIPRIQEAFFMNNGASLIARYLDRDQLTIQTYEARLVPGKGTTSPGTYTLEGSFLPQNISDFSVSPSGASFFYLIPRNTGASGYVRTAGTKNVSLVFDSPAKEWLSVWSSDRSLEVVSRPSSGVPSYSYTIDPKISSVQELFSPKNGLTILGSPDQSLLLYSETESGLSSRLFFRKTNQVAGFKVATLPDKCAWENSSKHFLVCAIPVKPKNALLPDEWYMGSVSYDDEIWRFDITNNTGEQIASLNQFTLGPVDVMRPFITPDNKYFIFMSKKDLTLWGVRIAE